MVARTDYIERYCLMPRVKCDEVFNMFDFSFAVHLFDADGSQS